MSVTMELETHSENSTSFSLIFDTNTNTMGGLTTSQETATQRTGTAARVPQYSQMYVDFMWTMNFVLLPCLSILGITGNVITAVVIFKQGLSKSSNILLISLTVADICFLCLFSNIFQLLHNIKEGKLIGFPYPKHASYFLFVLTIFFRTIGNIGLDCTLTLPVYISIERFIAVYFPLHFRSLVTPKRTWIAVSLLFLISAAGQIYRLSFVNLYYLNIIFNNMIIQTYLILRASSASYYPHKNILNVLTTTDVLHGYIAPSLVLLLCGVVFIKVKITTYKRQKLTDKEISSSKTTKVLLTVCALYFFCQCFNLVGFYVPKTDLFLASSYGQMCLLLYVLNSSCNFIIYVVMNKNFRDTYKAVLFCKDVKSVSQKSSTSQHTTRAKI